jgi:hypothetical protein
MPKADKCRIVAENTTSPNVHGIAQKGEKTIGKKFDAPLPAKSKSRKKKQRS